MLLAAAIGCGDSQPSVKRYPVKGTVTYEGKPLPSGNIQFTNTADGGVDGMKIENGAFNGQVQAGKRKVEITAMKEAASPMPGVKNEVNYIPEKYNAKTTLEAEVKAGPDGTNDFKFELTP